MIAATSRAAYELKRTGSCSLLLAGRDIERVAVKGPVALIMLTDGEVIVHHEGLGRQTYRSGFRVHVDSLLVLSEYPLSFLVGTEGGSLFRCDALNDELRPVRVCSFEDLDCREGWYAPWGDSVTIRSLARTPDGWVYAGIEAGSLMRSHDQGRTWQAVAPSLNEVVQQVMVCPAAPERIYVNTTGGPYVSYDHGTSWIHRAQGWGGRCGSAVAVHPDHPDCLLASISDGGNGSDLHAQLLRSDDAGETWESVTAGFPASTPHNIDGDHLAFGREGCAWAAVEQDLFMSRDRGASWERVKHFDGSLLSIGA